MEGNKVMVEAKDPLEISAYSIHLKDRSNFVTAHFSRVSLQ